MSTSWTFAYNFVQELLGVIFFPSSVSLRHNTPNKKVYASEIVRYLLERRVVSSSMLASHGGILSVLRVHGDWVKPF